MSRGAVCSCGMLRLCACCSLALCSALYSWPGSTSCPLNRQRLRPELGVQLLLLLLLQTTVSVIILVLFLLLESGPQGSPHFMPLLRALLPWALHHRHAVRVPVQVR